MKTLIFSALCLGFVTVAASAQQAKLTTRIDSASYSIGWDIGNSLKAQGVSLTPSMLAQGITDALGAQKSALTDEQMQGIIMELRQEMAARAQEKMEQMALQNQNAGAAYLAENKKKKGVTTLPSGLQYEVLKQGSGPMPKATDNVTVHYTGKLIDGTVFDSSVQRGEPAEFKVNGVIRGWTEALQLMNAGSQWRLFIPAELAYGTQGAGQTIGPNSVLVFDVELLKVN